jgi:hypothetical protein
MYGFFSLSPSLKHLLYENRYLVNYVPSAENIVGAQEEIVLGQLFTESLCACAAGPMPRPIVANFRTP